MLKSRDKTRREHELISSIPDTELCQVMMGNVMVSAPGLHNTKGKIKGKGKGGKPHKRGKGSKKQR